MCSNFVLLANGAAGDEVVDENRKSRPPKVTFDNGFGAKSSKMTRKGGRMDGVQERRTSRWWYIHTAFVIEVAVVKGPVGEGGSGEKGCFVGEVLDSTKNERVGGRRRLNMAGKGEIEGINDGGFGNDGGIVIVEGSVDLVVAREGVGGGKFGTGENFPDDVEVL